MGKLDNKIALVTGSSSGIGAAITRQFAAEGASVIVNYVTGEENARIIVEEILSTGGKAIAIQADLTREEDIDRLFTMAMTAFGRIDILVNNAGLFEFLPLKEITRAHIEQHFQLNITALILCCKKAAESFNNRTGTIINISSCDARYPPPSGSVYSASKAAVDAITISLSKELGQYGIRVNAINPGLVKTEGAEKRGFLTPDVIRDTIRITPLGRIAEPIEIARVAVFLASEDASWITGECLVVSGGQK